MPPENSSTRLVWSILRNDRQDLSHWRDIGRKRASGGPSRSTSRAQASSASTVMLSPSAGRAYGRRGLTEVAIGLTAVAILRYFNSLIRLLTVSRRGPAGGEPQAELDRGHASGWPGPRSAAPRSRPRRGSEGRSCGSRRRPPRSSGRRPCGWCRPGGCRAWPPPGPRRRAPRRHPPGEPAEPVAAEPGLERVVCPHHGRRVRVGEAQVDPQPRQPEPVGRAAERQPAVGVRQLLGVVLSP